MYSLATKFKITKAVKDNPSSRDSLFTRGTSAVWIRTDPLYVEKHALGHIYLYHFLVHKDSIHTLLHLAFSIQQCIV